MPRMHPRAISSAIDVDEGELMERARAVGLSVRFNTRAKYLGLPYVELFSKQQRHEPLAVFKRSRAAIDWIDAGASP